MYFPSLNDYVRVMNELDYFESIDRFKEELIKYLLYYNQMRPHQALGGKTPQDFYIQLCQRIS